MTMTIKKLNLTLGVLLKNEKAISLEKNTRP